MSAKPSHTFSSGDKPGTKKSFKQLESITMTETSTNLETQAATEMPQVSDIPATEQITSSDCPWFSTIPTVALVALAERFKKGAIIKKDKCWNALTKNQEVIGDKDLIVERINHGIFHLLKLRDKIAAGDVAGILEDDDAAAVAWSGVFLICAVAKWIKNQKT